MHDGMRWLLLLLDPLALADPAIAFDGGWYDKKEKPELSTDQSETLGKYSEFHQSCIDIQRWRACLDEARKTLDACTTHEKLGVLHRLSFEFDQIYGLYAARLYDQGWGKE